MLTTRPLTDSFALAYVGDPAFDSHRFDVDGKATEEFATQFLEEFDRCAETQDYAPLCLPGEKPTLFWFRPIKMMEVDRIVALNLGGQRSSTAAFRLCLQRIEDPTLGAIELKREGDREHPGLGLMLTESRLNEIVGKVGDFDFVHFLGNYVFARSRANPKR